ncbi:hypothetical protein BaRGS_00007020 [Batillaria attramentaria]|uniref:Uncharacterized protein n=1 Tax=Batillaria attramentaria TaxID=370345 RepID=A0ABD0LPJ1_9CAEN
MQFVRNCNKQSTDRLSMKQPALQWQYAGLQREVGGCVEWRPRSQSSQPDMTNTKLALYPIFHLDNNLFKSPLICASKIPIMRLSTLDGTSFDKDQRSKGFIGSFKMRSASTPLQRHKNDIKTCSGLHIAAKETYQKALTSHRKENQTSAAQNRKRTRQRGKPLFR